MTEIHARRLNAKEVLTPMKGDNFIFSVADTKEESGDVDLSESETGCEEDVTGKPVADDVWPKQQRRKQNKGAIETLDNARQLRGIFFIEPNDEDFKLTISRS